MTDRPQHDPAVMEGLRDALRSLKTKQLLAASELDSAVKSLLVAYSYGIVLESRQGKYIRNSAGHLPARGMADKDKAKRLINELAHHAERLTSSIHALPLNVRIAFRSDAFYELPELLDDFNRDCAGAIKRIAPKGKARLFVAQTVDQTAARIYSRLTNKKSRTNHNEYNPGAAGQYPTFLQAIFAALSINAKPAGVIQTRLAKMNKRKHSA